MPFMQILANPGVQPVHVVGTADALEDVVRYFARISDDKYPLKVMFLSSEERNGSYSFAQVIRAAAALDWERRLERTLEAQERKRHPSRCALLRWLE